MYGSYCVQYFVEEDDNTNTTYNTTTTHSIPSLQQVADESKNKLDDKQYAA